MIRARNRIFVYGIYSAAPLACPSACLVLCRGHRKPINTTSSVTPCPRSPCEEQVRTAWTRWTHRQPAHVSITRVHILIFIWLEMALVVSNSVAEMGTSDKSRSLLRG